MPKPLTTDVGEHTEPRMAADGRRLVCTLLEMRQSLVRLPVRRGGSQEPRAITNGYTSDLDPAFSPRGDRIVFSTLRAGSRSLWTITPDGGQPMPITSGTAIDERPAFSPDGQQIAFVSDRGGRRGIWVMSAEGGAPRFVGPAAVLDTLSWSPDGKRILYATSGGDLPQLATVAVADGAIQLIPTPGGGFAPGWVSGERSNRVLQGGSQAGACVPR
jgi:TolB protein